MDRTVCLGDIVGYNAEPDGCVELLAREGIESVAGNHDLVALTALGLERCAVRPAFALRRTRKALSDATREALAALPYQLVLEDDVVLVHAGFHDVCQYVRSPERVRENHDRMRRDLPRARICFFGHTHEQAVFEIHRGVVVARSPAREVKLWGPGRAFFLNPGSVDAARKDGDRGTRAAEAAVFDSDRRIVTFHRVPYDFASVEREATAAGYRMTVTEERAYRAARAVARRTTAAWRRVRGWWPFGATEPAPEAPEGPPPAPAPEVWPAGWKGKRA